MRDLRALLALCRVSNLPTVWMNTLAGVLLAGGEASGWIVVLLAVSMSAFYCHGMALNDLCDLEHDRVHQPFRPIPAGRVTLATARAVAGALLALGLALLVLAPHPSAVFAGLALAAVIAVYDRLHKRYAASVLAMAACRTLVFVTCAWAATGTAPLLVWLGGSVAFAHTLVVSVVARREAGRSTKRSFPVVPNLIAAMALSDGAVLALCVDARWLVVGALAAGLTRFGQRYVRGD